MPAAEGARLRASSAPTRRRRPPRHKPGERFLKGPIPLSWLEVAAALPGRSLHAGLALWYAAGLTRSASVPMSNISGLRFGLDRNAKYRALDWLEEAGLIIVERKLGRAPVVTLVSLREPPDRPVDPSV